MNSDQTVMEATTRGVYRAVKELTAYKMMVLIMLSAICITTFFISVGVGSLKISVYQAIRAIFVETEGINHQIIWNVRLPRTLVAALVGVCLSLSGAILQGIMRNPMAAPNIIGVSSGAGFAGMMVLIYIPSYSYLLTPIAFLGAMGATILIYLLSWRNGVKPVHMILAGVAVSSFLGAGINTLMTLFPERVQGVIDFMVGGLNARTWKHFYVIWPYAAAGFILVNTFSKRLNILMLGDEIASNLGLNVNMTRMIFIGLSSLLAASAVSVVGLLGFVGLIVPHITRLLIGSDYRFLFPAGAILGATVVMGCDTIARVVMDPIELPVGIIMSLLGAPFFLYLLRGGIKRDH